MKLVSTTESPVIVTESSARWSLAVRPKLPSNAKSSVGGYLSSISCPSQGNCVAVGEYFAGEVGRNFAVTESAGSWSQGVELPLPGNASSANFTSAVVSSVACTSVSCAVGEYPTGTSDQAEINTETAGVWNSTEASMPSDESRTGNSWLIAVGGLRGDWKVRKRSWNAARCGAPHCSVHCVATTYPVDEHTLELPEHITTAAITPQSSRRKLVAARPLVESAEANSASMNPASTAPTIQAGRLSIPRTTRVKSAGSIVGHARRLRRLQPVSGHSKGDSEHGGRSTERPIEVDDAATLAGRIVLKVPGCMDIRLGLAYPAP